MFRYTKMWMEDLILVDCNKLLKLDAERRRRRRRRRRKRRRRTLLTKWYYVQDFGPLKCLFMKYELLL